MNDCRAFSQNPRTRGKSHHYQQFPLTRLGASTIFQTRLAILCVSLLSSNVAPTSGGSLLCSLLLIQSSSNHAGSQPTTASLATLKRSVVWERVCSVRFRSWRFITSKRGNTRYGGSWLWRKGYAHLIHADAVSRSVTRECHRANLFNHFFVLHTSRCQACPRGLTFAWWGCYGLYH